MNAPTADQPATGRVAQLSYPSDTELVITRDFRAPRELVLAALTRPEHVREWYGLRAGTLKVCEIDFRVGGRWHYVLADEPDDLSFSGEYLAIDEDGFTSTESFDNLPGASYTARITLTEHDGVTTLRSALSYPAKEMRDGHVQSGMESGMNICYARLDALLDQLQA